MSFRDASSGPTSPLGTSSEALAFPKLLGEISFDLDGLVPAIIQDDTTNAVLMLGYMSAETLSMTLEQGRTVFWSRSRQEIWRKGDTSGNEQRVRSVHYDCDGDTLLIRVEQVGDGACHTGEYSCFYRKLG